MKKLLLALVLVSVGGVMADALPKGPYLHDCYYCTFKKKVLKCRCHDPKGGRHDSSLIVNPEERRVISNQNGILTFFLPKGSYQRSCKDCTFDLSNLLTCSCSDGIYYQHPTSLTVTPEETQNIINKNGTLQFDTSVHM